MDIRLHSDGDYIGRADEGIGFAVYAYKLCHLKFHRGVHHPREPADSHETATVTIAGTGSAMIVSTKTGLFIIRFTEKGLVIT